MCIVILQHVSVPTGGGSRPPGQSGDGGRSDLLEQIRLGVKLNSVPKVYSN